MLKPFVYTLNNPVSVLKCRIDAPKFVLRFGRRAGEMLKEREKHPPGPSKEDRSHDGTQLYPPRLEELGITKNQSSRWQLIASIPEQDFERRVESLKTSEKELTSNEILSLAGYLRRERDRQERRQQASETAANIQPDDRIRIFHGDFREVLTEEIVPNGFRKPAPHRSHVRS